MLGRLVSNSWPRDLPTSASQSAGIIGVATVPDPFHLILQPPSKVENIIFTLQLRNLTLVWTQSLDSYLLGNLYLIKLINMWIIYLWLSK